MFLVETGRQKEARPKNITSVTFYKVPLRNMDDFKPEAGGRGGG